MPTMTIVNDLPTRLHGLYDVITCTIGDEHSVIDGHPTISDFEEVISQIEASDLSEFAKSFHRLEDDSLEVNPCLNEKQIDQIKFCINEGDEFELAIHKFAKACHDILKEKIMRPIFYTLAKPYSDAEDIDINNAEERFAKAKVYRYIAWTEGFKNAIGQFFGMFRILPQCFANQNDGISPTQDKLRNLVEKSKSFYRQLTRLTMPLLKVLRVALTRSQVDKSSLSYDYLAKYFGLDSKDELRVNEEGFTKICKTKDEDPSFKKEELAASVAVACPFSYVNLEGLGIMTELIHDYLRTLLEQYFLPNLDKLIELNVDEASKYQVRDAQIDDFKVL